MNQPAIKEQPITGEIMPHEIAAYNPFRAQIAEMRAINEKTLFNYADPKGNKEARSYLYKLRQSKSEVERVRKAEKAASLEWGRKVDAEAKMIVDEIEAMIAVHEKPLKEIEDREKIRVAEIRGKIDAIHAKMEGVPTVAAIKQRIAEIPEIDASFAEFQEEAKQVRYSTLAALQILLTDAEKREAEAAELERLRKEAAERAQRDHEERIAREAAERARKEAEEKAAMERAEAEAKAKAELEAIERKAREEREAAERAKAEAEAEKLAAERKAEAERAEALRREAELQKEKEEAERRATQAAEAERQRIQREAEAKAVADAKREADKKHQASIHAAIVVGMAACGVPEESAKAVIVAIRKGEIPHVKIIY